MDHFNMSTSPTTTIKKVQKSRNLHSEKRLNGHFRWQQRSRHYHFHCLSDVVAFKKTLSFEQVIFFVLIICTGIRILIEFSFGGGNETRYLRSCDSEEKNDNVNPCALHSYRQLTRTAYLTRISMPITIRYYRQKQNVSDDAASDDLNGVLGVALPDDDLWDASRADRPNYGGLSLRLRRIWSGHFERFIRRDDLEYYDDERYSLLHDVQKNEYHYEVDYDHFDDLDWTTLRQECFRPRTTYAVYQTCNSFHERPMQRLNDPRTGAPIRYLGEGYYRASWWLPDPDPKIRSFVLKNLRLCEDHEYDRKSFQQVQIEAMVMERTLSSDLTTNIMGHCGVSTFVERAFPFETKMVPNEYAFLSEEEAEALDGQPQNDISSPQKLAIALAMAEGLALLHGMYDGVFVNDDIQISQWLLGVDNKIKLNDFNKAIIMEWSPVNQTYCTFSSSYDHQYRAPEELNWGLPVTEKADIFSFGQVLYTMLTGLIPYYDLKDRQAVKDRNRDGGELPYIDPSYRNSSDLIIRRLVEIIEPCYQHQPEDRSDIFTVVSKLRETAQMYETNFPNAPRIEDVSLVDIIDKVYTHKSERNNF